MARNRAWVDQVWCGSTLASESSFSADLLVGGAPSDTLTVARIILDLTFNWPAGLGVDASACVSVGIGVSSVEAFAAAATGGLPNPAIETSYPPRGWLYVATLPAYMWANISVLSAKFDADLHAMRKIDKGVLFIHAVHDSIVGVNALEFTGRARVLCLT